MTGLADIVPITPMQSVPLWRQIILLHGEPKIGKTTLISGFKNCIYFDAEQGTMGIDVPTFENLLPNRDRINSPIRIWEDVLKATDVIEQAAGKGVEGTIVVDTASAAFEMARTYQLNKMGISHETDLGYGKGWRGPKDEFQGWVSRIKTIGFGLVFISHTKEIEIETPTAKYQRKVPKLDTGPNDIILPFVNMIWYAESMHVQGRDFRVVHTKGNDKITAGERGKVTRLQELLPMDLDIIQRNWDGEAIDLNVEFGFAPRPAAPHGSVEPAQAPQPAQPKAQGAASGPEQSSGIENLKQAFDAKEMPGSTYGNPASFDSK